MSTDGSTEPGGSETTAKDGRRSGPDLSDRKAAMRSVGGSALARILVLPISAILGILVTRLVIDNYGQATYGQYVLLVGIGALIPFADLGISAALMNTIAGAENPRTDDHVRRVMVTCFRVLAGSCVVIVIVAMTIQATGLWPTLLGKGLTAETGALAATLCLVMIALGVLVSFGQRILAALGLNGLSILLTGLQTPIVLLALWGMISWGVGGGYLAVVSYGATALICLVGIFIAARRISPMIGTALADAWHVRSVRGGQVFNVAWPMLIQMIALPIAMQSSRVVLSQIGTLDDLTEFSLAAQMFMPVVGVVSAAGYALWPVFARARETGRKSPVNPAKLALVFGGLAVIVALAIAFASGLLARIATNGTIELSTTLVATFVAFVLVQSLKQPFGMYLTDPAGMRFQAFFILGMLPINLGLSIGLTPTLGPVAPLLASIVGVLLCQLIPDWLLVRHRLRKAAVADES